MTIAEFKAWLEGYTANMGVAPTAEQWKAIKAKLDKLQVVTVEPLYPHYKWREPKMWWKCPSYDDNKTVPLRDR